ncbi:MAG: hypothetical protein ACYS8L_05430 [Planctomycetota bacterium]
MSRAQERIDETLPQLTEVVDEAVREIVDQHMDDIKSLEREDLSQRLREAFEESAGGVLDEFSAGVGESIKGVKGRLRELIHKKESGAPLTQKEELELRYIQLWKTYWAMRMVELEQ